MSVEWQLNGFLISNTEQGILNKKNIKRMLELEGRLIDFAIRRSEVALPNTELGNYFKGQMGSSIV